MAAATCGLANLPSRPTTKETNLKLKLIACAAFSCIGLLPGLSEAKGCLKGAAVGGVGGHVAGHHGLIGAAAGCAVGHHMANKKQATAAPSPATPAAMPAPAQTAPAKP